MAFTTFTLADAWDDMGSRLADPDHVRWPTAELTIYVQQALRTYNAFTNHFREAADFQTASPQAFYDLPTIAPALRGFTYTVAAAVQQISRQLLEVPPSGSTWNGTDQFSLADITQALQQARDTFLLETGVIVTRSTMAMAPIPVSNVVDLDEIIFNLRRLAWVNQDGIITVLRRTDQWGISNFKTGWQTLADRPPIGYSVSVQPPLKVQLAPRSTQTGTLDLLTLNRGVAPDLNDPAQVLGVPDDWAWLVIFGALAQLLQRDGLALDTGRATYCDARWKHGLGLARTAAVVLGGEISGQTVALGSVSDADAFSASWQMVPAIPKRILTAGQTVVALWPPPGVPPGGGNFTVTLDLVRNAPVPVINTDVLQVGNEVINDLLDYAQHLALWKEGPGQLQASQGLLDQFMRLCGTTIAIQYASQPNETATDNQTVKDVQTVAYGVQ